MVKIAVQNNNPTVYVNNVAASTGGSGGSGGGGTTGETKLIDRDVTGKAYHLTVVSFAVPTGVKRWSLKQMKPKIIIEIWQIYL